MAVYRLTIGAERPLTPPLAAYAERHAHTRKGAHAMLRTVIHIILAGYARQATEADKADFLNMAEHGVPRKPGGVCSLARAGYHVMVERLR